jgi:hypothetical protein
MKSKLVILALLALAAALALVPSASAVTPTVTGISPSSGQGGTTVLCHVAGTFDATTAFLVTTVKLKLPAPSSTSITGTIVTVTATRIDVNFALPAGVDYEGVYDVNVDQWLFIPGDGVTLAGVFSVSPPAITSLDPASVAAGSPELSLTVHGANFRDSGLFYSGSSVRWNGAAVSTTYNSPTQLTAVIPATKLTTAGTASVTVMNVSAGTTSAPVTFTIAVATPVVTSLSPASVWAGYVKNDVTLTVNGSNFIAGAHIFLSGGEKTNTTFVSATQLTVPLVAADLAAPGTLTVSVKNPPIPPGTPSALALTLPVVAETTDPTVTIAGADSGWHNTAVPLTFSAADAQSGVQKVQYQSPPTVPAWVDGSGYTVPVTTQGPVVVSVQALDWCNRVGTASVTVNIDTTKPATDALNAVSVKRNKTAALKFRISEPTNLSPRADVVIKIKAKKGGNTVKTISVPGATVNATQIARVKASFAKGSYKWYVYATDLAGNTQANVDSASLTVK